MILKAILQDYIPPYTLPLFPVIFSQSNLYPASYPTIVFKTVKPHTVLVHLTSSLFAVADNMTFTVEPHFPQQQTPTI